MKYKTRQEMFDRVWQCFVVDKQPQCKPNVGPCSYVPINNNTVGCAVGCLLEHEEQKRFQEYNWSVSSMLTGNMGYQSDSHKNDLAKSLFLKNFNREDVEFLDDCQSAHDSNFEYFKESLREIAIDYRLIIPENQ